MGPSSRSVPQYCYQCVAGPDLLAVKVTDGVATEIQPNFGAAAIHPGGGKCCVKAYGLIQKTYNPHRLATPMRRTNPRKGRGEDPGFVSISWAEALELVAAKLNAVRAKGLIDDAGFPRVAATFGGGGTPTYYMGTFPAFLAAWGPIDFSFGSGQGVKCDHTEHLYGELWHRAFTVSSDTPTTDFVLSFGANLEASGGVVGVWRHAEARVRGLKRVQLEPHLSVTGAAAAEWVPIKPKTDAAFLFALIRVLLHEQPRAALDLPFLVERTGAPYLVGPAGYFLRDPATRKPLVWDAAGARAVAFDTPGVQPALEGRFAVPAIEVGPDQETLGAGNLAGATAFTLLVEHMRPYTPDWAEAVCDIRPGTVRRLAAEFLAHARVGATTVVDGVELPLRPVAIVLGKTVTNGWGGYECCWARTVAACLVGGLEVPGGTLGTTVRLNRPATSRQASVKPGPDGFMVYPMNPTDREHWEAVPRARNGHATLVPLSSNSPWSQALGPTHLAWMFRDRAPAHWPAVTLPEVWFVYRTNPVISFWETATIGARIAEFAFTVAFAYTVDETNWFADVLLPERTDLESTQLIRVGGSKFVEQFWDYEGFALRQAAVAPRGDTRDMSDIATELAVRVGLLEGYNEAINGGAAGVALRADRYDFALDPAARHDADTIWDRVCRAASWELTDGAASDGLDWYRSHGYRARPISRLAWYLYPELVRQGLRFEMPYQERLARIGDELGRRLHERGIAWWDAQLTEYQALPSCKDFGAIWERHAIASGGRLDELAFWLVTSRAMPYSWGANAGIQLMDEVAENLRGHRGVVINAGRARALGIAEGDLVEVRSTAGATRGRAMLREGIRPDTLLMIGQFDHWATPYAKDLGSPSMNGLVPLALELTDATGSAADLVRVSIARCTA